MHFDFQLIRFFFSLKVVHALGKFFLPQSSTIPRRWCASCSDYSSGEKIRLVHGLLFEKRINLKSQCCQLFFLAARKNKSRKVSLDAVVRNNYYCRIRIWNPNLKYYAFSAFFPIFLFFPFASLLPCKIVIHLQCLGCHREWMPTLGHSKNQF